MEKNVFIEKARKVHGDKYDYSLLPNTFKTTEKIKIICKSHGAFEQRGCDHLQGCGCRKCKYDKLSESKKDNADKFIEKARKVHGDKYDYSKVEYVNSETPVCIICHEIDPLTTKEHGEFWQTPNAHIQKRGCPKCKQEKISNSGLKNADVFFEKCIKKFNGKYSYDKSIYINNTTPILINCPEHGEFWQTPKMHYAGFGCPKCSYEYRGEVKKSSTKEFIEKARKVHGNKYDYSKVEYVNSETKVCIICHEIDPYGNEHGEFWQYPSHHLYGYGCDKCAKDNLRLTTKEFIAKAREKHGDKYDYSKVEYTHSRDNVTIICPEHGEFSIMPNVHLNGSGCPKCGFGASQAEKEIYDFICTLVPKNDIITKNRSVLDGYELDIYIPSKKIAIEYDGLYWHSEACGKDKFYHLLKTEKCAKKDIKLIHVFEDEFNNKDLIFSKIRHLLHCSNTLQKIPARKTNITVINNVEAKEFLNRNHIQGFAKSTYYLGAYYENKLIAVMSFVGKGNEEYELNRFASDYDYACQGIGGRLFKYFIRNYNPNKIKSFADRRWTPMAKNNIYTQLGFKINSILRPDYYYIVNGKRIHKFNCRKERLHKKYNLPLTMTENEMIKQLNFHKIWNCGLIKYVWTKD